MPGSIRPDRWIDANGAAPGRRWPRPRGNLSFARTLSDSLTGWRGLSGHAVQVALATGVPHIYTQQGGQPGGHFDEIAIDPINLQPGDEPILVKRPRVELARR